MADLEELAGRVEALSGPDREVDAAIHAYLASAADWAGFPDWITPDNSPSYTASIDAAMTLADDGDIAELLNESMEFVGQHGWKGGDYKGALTRAFVAQCLRARTQGNPNGS